MSNAGSGQGKNYDLGDLSSLPTSLKKSLEKRKKEGPKNFEPSQVKMREVSRSLFSSIGMGMDELVGGWTQSTDRFKSRGSNRALGTHHPEHFLSNHQLSPPVDPSGSRRYDLRSIGHRSSSSDVPRGNEDWQR